MLNASEITTVKPQVTITSSAVKAIKRLCIEQNIPTDELGLRLGVKGGGCSGFSYEIGFDDINEDDYIFEIEGLRVLIKEVHSSYLLGIEVDWENGLNNRGFTLNNPNATSTCGCGNSFSA